MKYEISWAIGGFGIMYPDPITFDSFEEAADYYTDFMKRASAGLAEAAFFDFDPDVYDDPDTAEKIVDYIEDFFNGSIDPGEPLIINYDDHHNMIAQLTSDGIYIENRSTVLKTDFLCVNDPDRDYSFSFKDKYCMDVNGESLEFSLELRRAEYLYGPFEIHFQAHN